MLWDEIRTLDTSKRALRSFGLVVGLVFIGIAFVLWWRHDWTAGITEYGLGGIGGALLVAGLLLPGALKPIYRVWMALALVLGFVMTRLLLTLVFYLMLTPIGLVRRAFGQDPMRRTRGSGVSSYWISKEYTDELPRRLEKYY